MPKKPKQPKQPKQPLADTSLSAAFDLGKGKADLDAKFQGWKRVSAGIMAGKWSDGTVVYRDRTRKAYLAGKP